MFQLSPLAHHRGLAIAFGLRGGDPKGRNTFIAQQSPQLCADVHQRGQVLGIRAYKGVFDHGHSNGLARGGRYLLPDLAVSLFDPSGDFADFGAHLKPSFPSISFASNPPARLWIRAPVVITRITAISSARGLSFRPTSIESKWLRT